MSKGKLIPYARLIDSAAKHSIRLEITLEYQKKITVTYGKASNVHESLL